MSKNLIITFEGIEGSGKSFHIKSISSYLKRKKLKYIVLREPGGSINSEKIRKLILNKNNDFNSYTDLLLYLAARSENIEKIIKKNYKKKIILIDRFVDSTMAYQGFGMNIDKSLITSINKLLLRNISIDFTFLNIVNSNNLISRLSKRKKLNRYDKFKTSFYTKVQKGFIKLSKKNKNKYLIVDSNKAISHNKKIILNKINKLLKIK